MIVDDEDWDMTFLDGMDITQMSDDELIDKAHDIKENVEVLKERADIDLERIDAELRSRGLPKAKEETRCVH